MVSNAVLIELFFALYFIGSSLGQAIVGEKPASRVAVITLLFGLVLLFLAIISFSIVR